MELVKLQSTIALAAYLALCSSTLAGCARSQPTPPPVGKPAPPGAYDELKLQVDGRDALDGKAVLVSGKPFTVTGGFRIVKPYKGRPPIGPFVIKLTKAFRGGELTARSGSGRLTISGDRRATFVCKPFNGAPQAAGEYTLKVKVSGKIVMEAKVQVKD